MQIQEHLRRAAGFETSAARLDPIEDGELYVIFLMRAGTNRVNAALHAMGVTEVQASAKRVGDLNHSYKPRLEGELPAEVKQMFEPLSFIENLRPLYVRGPATLTPELARESRAAYDDIVARTSRIIGRLQETAS